MDEKEKESESIGIKTANVLLEVFVGGCTEIKKIEEVYLQAKKLSAPAYEILFRKMWDDIKKSHPIIVKEIREDIFSQNLLARFLMGCGIKK